MSNFDVIKGKKGQKQVRFWSHPKVNPVNQEQIEAILNKEFAGVPKSQRWIIPGFMNFWVEETKDGTVDTES